MTRPRSILPPVTPRRPRPTMRDVADGAGVSLQTVSNYVNGRLNLMSEGTRERVGRELDRLGYRPNAAARSLRERRTRTLGFLVLDEAARFLADPMTDLILAGIGDVARDNGYSLLIQAARPEPDDVDRLFSPLLEERVDGAFLFLSGSPAVRRRTIRRVDELGSNFVVFEQAPPRVRVVSVTAENRAGARRLAEHLLERGHSRIAFVATRTPWPMVEERLRGYRDALAASGHAAPELVATEGVWNPADGARMAERELVVAAHDRGRRPPGGAAPRPSRPRRPGRHRLQRLRVRAVRRPAADDGSRARLRPRPDRRGEPRRPDRRRVAAGERRTPDPPGRAQAARLGVTGGAASIRR